MNAAAIARETGNQFEQLKSRLKSTWMSGDYGTFARYMEKGAQEFFGRLDVRPGSRLLDVACGAGQLALIAARAGADVTGCDIASNWLEQARDRAACEGIPARFEEGDAECLPYGDHQFDVVTSLVGAMFAPRPEQVASELTRVCRPGGTIAMANWTPGGFIGKMFKAIAAYIAPARMPSPVLWGNEEIVRERLGPGTSDISCTRRMYRFEYPFRPHEVVDFLRQNYGPMSKAFLSLDTQAQEKLRRELVMLWYSHNDAQDDTTRVDAEYLEVVATRAKTVGETRPSARPEQELQ